MSKNNRIYISSRMSKKDNKEEKNLETNNINRVSINSLNETPKSNKYTETKNVL